ncbi:hypothetical protein HpDR37_19690 [Helicobacter pylori]
MYKNCVFIIESPNKIAKIKELTGSSFVFATGGHFVELINIEVSKEFNPIFEIKKSTDKKKDRSTHINHMINQCKDKVVYIATDPDREGYGIGYKFYEKIKNLAKTIYRTEFHEITKSGVEKVLNNAVLFSQSNLNLYYSWLGRIVSDQQVKAKAKEQQKTQREKTLNGFLKKVGLKKRDMLQSTMLFDGVKEADVLFQAERKIGDWIFSSAVFFFALALIEAIIIACLLPLKEKVPYLVTFSNATQNFAIVQRADKSIRANQALVRQLVASYVNNRENISSIKEQNEIAHETIRLQSSFEVWDFFEKLVSYEHSIYTNINLTRKISIINIALISKTQANIEISAQLFNKEKLESEKRYRIIMTFEFEPIEIDTKSVPLNPTGFMVTGYDVTEIAILKDLDEKSETTPC